MGVLAVLTGLVLAAAAAPAPPHNRAAEIADTMVHALGKMVGGVQHFLTEQTDAKAERGAHAFIGGHQAALATQEDVDSAEEKGSHLATQVLKNLNALAQAAKALKVAAHEVPPPQAPMSDGEKDGYMLSLERKVAGQAKALSETEGENKNLVTSVAQLMHKDSDSGLKSQLAAALAKVVQLEQQIKDSAAATKKAATDAAQMRSDNSLLSQSLSECQGERKADDQGKVEESVVTTEVQCKGELAKVQQKLASVEGEHDSMVQTVSMMVQSSDDLKAKLAAKANCTTAVAVAAPKAQPSAFDVAHMAETVKIDQYIATNGHPTSGAPNATLEAFKPVHFKDASVKAASDALAGRGDIGKYLRGAKDDNSESKSGANAALAASDDVDTNDLEQQIDSLMPEDVDVLKAAGSVGVAKKKAVRKAKGADDNLAQKLLLQAEQTLKLAA